MFYLLPAKSFTLLEVELQQDLLKRNNISFLEVPKLNQKRKDQLLDTFPSNLNKCSNVIIEQLLQQNVTLSLRHLMNEEVLSRS